MPACFFSSFSVIRSKAVMNRRGVSDVVRGLHSCVVVAVCLDVSLLKTVFLCVPKFVFSLCFHVTFRGIKMPVANSSY